jgi:hypothetical protein
MNNTQAPMKALLWFHQQRFYWANATFTKPGLYVWLFGNNRRILPWTGGWQLLYLFVVASLLALLFTRLGIPPPPLWFLHD